MCAHGGVRRRTLPGAAGSGRYTSQRILIGDQGFCGARSQSERARRVCVAGTLSISSPLGQRAWEGVGGRFKTVHHRRGGATRRVQRLPMNERGAILRGVYPLGRYQLSTINYHRRTPPPYATAVPRGGLWEFRRAVTGFLSGISAPDTLGLGPRSNVCECVNRPQINGRI